MESVSVIEVTGSADSAYYSHQSFQSDASWGRETPDTNQRDQGNIYYYVKSFISIIINCIRITCTFHISNFNLKSTQCCTVPKDGATESV